MQIRNGQFLLGDTFERMAELATGSVDMILADLPYGTTACAWDTVLPLNRLWAEYWRIAKPSAAIVLTASQPFTSALVMSQVERFKYCWIWDKVNKVTDIFNAKKRPMRDHEDIPVFYKSQPTYNPQMRQGVYRTRRTNIGKNAPEVTGRPRKIDAGRDVDGLLPKRIIAIPGADTSPSLHPTRKPVALFEYLIRTYTNEGEHVLDNTAGSGTTAIAAERSGRRWTCIERDEEYYWRAIARLIDGDK